MANISIQHKEGHSKLSLRRDNLNSILSLTKESTTVVLCTCHQFNFRINWPILPKQCTDIMEP